MKLSFLAFTLVSFVVSQNYLWPTNASKVLTSSYAESRSDRFHTGIDITTWNKEGYDCYAISDGYIYRVVTGVYGYGRAIYVKLSDGKIAVYAHTQKFREDINNYVREKQSKSLSYKQDLYFSPNQFPVKKGDIVAYTGSTGIGVPHLHFEIRDSMNKTLNPLMFYPKFKDRNRPNVSALIVTALDSMSSVSDSLIVNEFIPTQISKREYILDTIYASGKIGLSIDVSDPTIPERRIATGVHRLELIANDSIIFASQFDTLLFSQNHLFNLDRDNFAKKYLNRRAQSLYVKKGNKLSYKTTDNGILNISDTISFQVNVYDYKKNKIQISGVILPKKGVPKSFVSPEQFLSNEPYILGQSIYNDSTDSISHKLSLWENGKKNVLKGRYLTYSSSSSGLFKNEFVYERKLSEEHFPQLNYYSEIVYLLPMQMELKKPLKIETNDSLPKNVGLFRWNRRKSRWDYENADRKDDGHFHFEDNSVRVHVLLQDSIPPKIRFTKWDLDSNSYFIYVKDDLSGIHSEKNFSLFSGDKQIVGEYDFEEDVIKIDKRDIIPGKDLFIRINDNLGNIRQRKIYISEHY